MQKILLTGGAGYIGSHICVELLGAGYDVVVLDDLSCSKENCLERVRKIAGKDFAFYNASALDDFALECIFSEEHISAVIHLAGYKAVGESVEKPLKYYENNIGATINLLIVMEKHGVTRMVFSSSATVYGMPDSVPIDESAKLCPTNPYGQTKFMCEQIIEDWCIANSSASAAILRYFNPIGAHESALIGEDPRGIPNNLLPYIMKIAVGELKSLGVFGNDYPTPDGTGVRDYLHIVDLAKGHLAALDYTNSFTGSDVFNLGTGKGYSVLDVVHAYEKVNGIAIPYEIKARRAGDVASCYSNPEKARRILGWKAHYTLEDMCRTAHRFIMMNPKGYEVKS